MDQGPQSLYFAKAFIEHLKVASYVELAAWAIGVWWLISFLTSKETPKVAGAPFVGRKSVLEPSFLQRLRFTTKSLEVLQDGYNKFKDRIFVVRRVDRDITILPAKYLDEMRSLPKSVIDGTLPQIQNLCASYTYIDFMYTSDLLVRTINRKLTPDLNKYTDLAKVEMDYSFEIDMPLPKDWYEFDIQKATHNTISRMSAKVFAGYPACRNQEWIDMSIQFTADLFGTGFILKHFPEWIRPIVAPLIPNRHRLRIIVEKGKKIIGKQMEMHKHARANGLEPDDTLLGWMIENGTEDECDIGQMTQRQLLLMLAGIHTTTMAIVHVLFDLSEHPEWVPVLREEIEEVTTQYGGPGENPEISTKTWLTKLEKLDSFLLESQRFEPSTQLKPQRVVLKEMTLQDGTQLPKGSMVAWAGHQHVHDPAVNPSPDTFDPMRAYRKRYANNKADYKKFVAGQNESSSLAFGYGNGACPGRYFAVNEIKLVLSRLIVEYDWALPKGTKRPKSYVIEENFIMDHHAKIMMRARQR